MRPFQPKFGGAIFGFSQWYPYWMSLTLDIKSQRSLEWKGFPNFDIET